MVEIVQYFMIILDIKTPFNSHAFFEFMLGKDKASSMGSTLPPELNLFHYG